MSGPDVTDWVIAVATVATAVFTGWTMATMRSQALGRVAVESHIDNMSKTVGVRLVLRNSTASSVRITKLTFRGMPSLDFRATKDKHESWAPGDCPPPTSQPIAPGKYYEFSVVLKPDWAAMHRRQQRPHIRLVNAFGRALYAATRWHSSGGMSVWIGASGTINVNVVTLNNSSQKRVIKCKIQIPPGTITQIAPQAASA